MELNAENLILKFSQSFSTTYLSSFSTELFFTFFGCSHSWTQPWLWYFLIFSIANTLTSWSRTFLNLLVTILLSFRGREPWSTLLCRESAQIYSAASLVWRNYARSCSGASLVCYARTCSILSLLRFARPRVWSGAILHGLARAQV